jgi:hypothetical protein
MQASVVVMINVWEILVPCTWVLGIVHVQYMHDHLIDDLGLAIYLGMGGHIFGELGVQWSPEARPKCVDESTFSIRDNGLWDSKMYPHFLKEELGSGLYNDALLVGGQKCHFREDINNHENTIIPPLGGWKA